MSLLSEKFPGSRRKSLNGYEYFLPASLSKSKDIRLPPLIIKQVQDAALALGEFSSLIDRIPNPELFIHAYTRKEATLSSRIEGTQTKIEDAFKEEAEIAFEKRDDWGEVNAYIQAMQAAMEQLKELPLCNRLIKDTHKILLSQVRGEDKQPGEFRKSQNWIGGSRLDNAHFVPPAHEYIDELMNDFELYIQNQKSPMPELINAALLHYQFESIHPFLDGNGRMGRMLIVLYLLEKKIINRPILYISTFLEQHRKEYYSMLDRAREGEGGIVKWVSFFMDAIEQTARDGINVTQKLLSYDRQIKDTKLPTLARKAKKGHQLLNYLYQRPVLTAKHVQKDLNFSAQISQALIKAFVELDILKEVTGNKRNRLFVFWRYIELL